VRQKPLQALARLVRTGARRTLGLLGRPILKLLSHIGKMSLFFWQAMAALPRRPCRGAEILLQIRFIGSRSMGIVVMGAAFTGLVLSLQGHRALEGLGQEGSMGSLVGLTLTRELAPVLGAILVAARAGSATAAALGHMRVSEQIDALRSMAVSPMHYLVAPRLVASVVSMPLLVAVFNVVGIGAALALSATAFGVQPQAFMESLRSAVHWSDVSLGWWKALLFGALLAWIATFRGYFASGGSQGVGLATTQAVVETCVVTLIADYVLSALLL
jgi:phospholipid/cholesterol/gamma-HCH transport system permease protein